jgi:RES domain
MFDWAELHRVELNDFDAYRCIHRRLVYTEELRGSMMNRLKRYGLEDLSATQLLDSTKRYLLNLTMEQLIAFHADYPFRAIPLPKLNNPIYPMGRFNDQTFPALYAAEDEETAVEEAWHNIRQKGANRFPYVVFSLCVTATVADIRPAITDNVWHFPEEHAPCQLVGKYLKERGFGGLLTYSKRRQGGTCCAVFARKHIMVGTIVDLDEKALH